MQARKGVNGALSVRPGVEEYNGGTPTRSEVIDTSSPFTIKVQVHEEFHGLVSAGWIAGVVEEALLLGASAPDAEVGVVIAGDDVVRELNRQHRGLDENTDVLSFSFGHQGEYYGDRPQPSPPGVETEFVLPPGEDVTLGEVIVSLPQARRQADQYRRPIEEELTLLLAHGVLHLLGHDHQIAHEEAAMKGLEAQVLDRVMRGRGGN